jgi:hypothetical protein
MVRIHLPPAQSLQTLGLWAFGFWREATNMACRTAARILVHYMINGGFLGAGGVANRDNKYILEHIAD